MVILQEEASSQHSHSDALVVSFSHLHLYVDRLKDLEAYKALEDRLNTFADQVKALDLDSSEQTQGSPPKSKSNSSLLEKQKLWKTFAAVGSGANINDSGKESKDSSSIDTGVSSAFTPHNRDVVDQLLAGFGFRVTAARYPTSTSTSTMNALPADTNANANTRSLLVTSRDPQGVQIIVTAIDPTPSVVVEKDPMRHFDASKVQRFLEAHDHRQGIAVLAFCVENVKAIREKYQTLHPNLVADYEEYPNTDSDSGGGGVKVLEVYAYYQEHTPGGDDSDSDSLLEPDTGTILRFLETNENNTGGGCCPLPGLTMIDALFEDSSRAAYCDHWVSNVFSRTEFLDTLKDTLGFTPKVDFNAGVVAAGEAQIESTVTGNTSASKLTDKKEALRDQSQVYLPINNALSSVGHVHGFLKELGQGVQHVASRVENLVEFVQRANDYRDMTGEGFTFLRIPRSYYGILTLDQLVEGIVLGEVYDGLGEECAKAVMETLEAAQVLTRDGAVDLDQTEDTIDFILEKGLDGLILEEYRNKRKCAIGVSLCSRHKNLYSLLRHHVSEENYLGIVRNQILVDIQGEDLLYQIFTASIVQRQPGEEAPFLEFIQRVCSECTDAQGCPQKVRPGCGGFGIRNFLTLFLSIEVSTAMQEVSDAKAEGDEERQMYATKMVDYFTDQLNESNPILTAISEAMTEEGNCKEEMVSCIAKEELKEADTWKAKMTAAADRKQEGNQKLMECSARYNSLMKTIRESRQTTKK
jgi:hypothetical protein